VQPDYVAVVDPVTFGAVARPDGRVLLALAARVGPVRLIDNDTIDLRPPAATG
jgi:pantoate--beta-alanine ligase